MLLLVLALMLIAIGVVGFSLSNSIGEIVRAAGNAPVDYDVSAGGQFGPPYVMSAPVWTNFLVWAPFPDVHSNVLKFDPWDAGIYMHDKNAVLPNVPGREERFSRSVVEWTPNRYVVRVVAPSDGYLLNLENYNRYWKARVDGRPEDILRANFTMKAIKLAEGEHIVEWRYDPVPLKLGWLAFYVVFAAVLIAFPSSGLRDHPPVPAAET
jgi:hypothetical protein